MERLAICRICLNENYTRLIPDTQLQAVYEKLTSMPFQNAMKPSVVCYTCHGQLYKTHSFMQQCMKAEELLSQMANQLLADDVQEVSIKIDSTDFTPSPCSTVQQVSIETLPDVKSGIHIEEEDVTDVKIEIKNIHIANNPRLATQNGRYIISNDKDNNDISRNKHSQQSDSCKFQCDEENVAKTLIINKNNEGEINKQNVNLIKSNENISDSEIMENSVQNVISDYHCDKESDVDNLQSTISQKNNKNFESCKKDCNIDVYLENKTQLVCDMCSKEFNSKSELASHVRLCTAIGPYICNVCDKSFTEKGNLKKHARVHTGERPYVCTVCDKRFTTNGVLKIHQRTHTAEKPYICTVCDKRFTTSGNLMSHARVHTDEKPYACNVCDKRFTTSGNLMSHARVHTDEKPYVCNVCNKTFTARDSLRKHVRVHTAEKPHICPVCDKKFTEKGSLRVHARVHAGEKPYACTLCDKRFTTSGSLRVHARVHTSEKPYICIVCDKRFTTSGNLREHARVHTGEKPYSCNICSKTFRQSTAVKSHLKLHNI